MSRIFGTDGVRGIANTELTPELTFAVGRAAATVLARSGEPGKPIVVGRDTRLSGSMLEAALVAGMTSVGKDVVSIGVVPTPAVATVTVRYGAAAGAMISASHNPIADNGIKFFGPDGYKLSDAVEMEIEALLSSPDLPRPTGIEIGTARVAQNLAKFYYDELYADAEDLSGLTVVVDGAYGAAYAIAPYALRKLGATVHEMHCENDGSRINVGCGATDVGPLRERVKQLIDEGNERTIGVAFDGDADRAMFVDEAGVALTGDHVMFVLGTDLHERGLLAGGTVVGTVMSNIGLEKALSAHGIALARAPVGDRYVLEAMRAGGFGFGGEQSGHIIDLRANTTGDGPRTAISLFEVVVRRGKRLHDLAAEMRVYPQVLVNVRTSKKEVLQQSGIRRAIAEAEALLTGKGRLLVRPSGTEPLIRVMIEGDDQGAIDALAGRLARRIEEAAAGA